MDKEDCTCEGSDELPVDGCPKHDPTKQVKFKKAEKDETGW